MKKLEKARALLSNRGGEPSYETVLETALDEFLKDHDPDERRKRREERKVKADARTKTGTRPTNRAHADGGASRRIPAAIKGAVFARDKGRCTQVGTNGKRCGLTERVAAGTTAENVRRPDRIRRFD